MEYVVDCSLALSWVLPDESSEVAEKFRDQLSKNDSLWVPSLWWYEISNGLLAALKRQRITEAECVRLLELLNALPLRTDDELTKESAWRFLAIGREYRLSAYDAAYLELAQRRGISLAALDERLIAAAEKSGVKIAI